MERDRFPVWHATTVQKTNQLAELLKLKTKVVGGVLLCAAFSSAALTVGRVRGAAWLGQPLDLSIPVHYDEADSPAALCFEAEVFHADTRQDPGRVRVTVENSPQPQEAQVRIQSSVLVDEPVVTIYLRVGCASKTTRRYVLLSEIPGELVVSPPLPLVSTVSTPPVPAAASESLASKEVTSSERARPAAPAALPVATPRPRPRAKAVSPEKAPSARDPAAELAKRKAEAGDKPRLKLESLELLAQRVAQLETSSAAVPPPEPPPQAQRLQKLESNVQSLLALAAKNEQNLTALRDKLQIAESERYDNGLVYGLGALLLASLTAVAYLWRRQRQVKPGADHWWGESERAADVAERQVVEPFQAVTTEAQTEMAKPVAPVQVEVDLDDLMAHGLGDGAVSPPAWRQAEEASHNAVTAKPEAAAPGGQVAALTPPEVPAALPELAGAHSIDFDFSDLPLSKEVPVPAVGTGAGAQKST